MANTNSGNFVSASSQYLNISSIPAFNPVANAFSVGAWFKTSSGAGNPMITTLGISGTGTLEYLDIYLNPTNNVKTQFQFINGGAQFVEVTTTGTYADNVWHHVEVVCYNTSVANVEVYVDGILDGSAAHATVTYSMTSIERLHIGSGYDPNTGSISRFFNGDIDEVRYWLGTQRTATEIAAQMCSELAGTETNLQGYWKLNGDANDSTANANNLTNNNSVTFTADVPFPTTDPTAVCYVPIPVAERIIFN